MVAKNRLGGVTHRKEILQNTEEGRGRGGEDLGFYGILKDEMREGKGNILIQGH